MLGPFQSLLYCSRSANQKFDVLLAASGCYILSFDVDTGSLLSAWPSPPRPSEALSTDLNHCEETESERQAKRRKVTLPRDASGSDSAEIVVENRLDIDLISITDGGSSSNVAKIISSADNKYIVAVTAEDKSIRVFELSDTGNLLQISVRPMPKRPCTIALTPDASTIICGDKFGDVYSLPLLGMTYENSKTESVESANSSSIEPPLGPFAPAANPRTVHTKKNLEALRNQQKRMKPKPEKQVLQFEHQLLLGHVSLLTDLAYVRLDQAHSPSHEDRDYIVTSDRDEHIRVSRGIPQAHIIEGYCLGHTEFVSSICVPQRKPKLLVSGGGDGHLLVWDWIAGTLRQKIDLRRLVTQTEDFKGKGSDPKINIAVSGIWDAFNGEPDGHGVDVIVTCEALPVILLFSFDTISELQWYDTLQTRCNVIEVAVLQERSGFIYSMDVFHEAGTTKSPSKTETLASQGSVDFRYFLQDLCFAAKIPTLSVLTTAMDRSAKTLTSQGVSNGSVSLYNLESLRKRDQEDPSRE